MDCGFLWDFHLPAIIFSVWNVHRKSRNHFIRTTTCRQGGDLKFWEIWFSLWLGTFLIWYWLHGDLVGVCLGRLSFEEKVAVKHCPKLFVFSCTNVCTSRPVVYSKRHSVCFFFTNLQIYNFNVFFFKRFKTDIFFCVYIFSSKCWIKVHSTMTNFPLSGPKWGLLFDFAPF